MSCIFLVEFNNNFMNGLLTDINFVHDFNYLGERHGENDGPNDSGSKFGVDGLNLGEDLVSQVLALSLLVSKLLELLECNDVGNLRRGNLNWHLRHLRHLRSLRSLHEHGLG